MIVDHLTGAQQHIQLEPFHVDLDGADFIARIVLPPAIQRDGFNFVRALPLPCLRDKMPGLCRRAGAERRAAGFSANRLGNMIGVGQLGQVPLQGV